MSSMSKRHHAKRLKRYHALVEQKHGGGGLTEREAREMERLGALVDRFYAPFYRPILRRVRGMIAAFEAEKAQGLEAEPR